MGEHDWSIIRVYLRVEISIVLNETTGELPLVDHEGGCVSGCLRFELTLFK